MVAAAWVTRLTSGGATEADAQALADWRRADPLHDRAYLEIVALRQAVARVANDYRRPPPTRFGEVDRRRLLGVGSVVGVTALTAAHYGRTRSDYVTRPGETLRLPLDGGGYVDLNTRTRADLDRVSGVVRVVLKEGELIATALQAPVVVASGRGQTTGVDAAFSIRREGDTSTVTSLRGLARVRCAGRLLELEPGRQARYKGEVLELIQSAVDVTRAVAWTTGALSFQNATLDEVAAELNRYRRSPIVIADRALARRTISGTFYLDRVDGFVDQVRAAFGATVTRLPGGAVVLH